MSSRSTSAAVGVPISVMVNARSSPFTPIPEAGTATPSAEPGVKSAQWSAYSVQASRL
jgi:hypothetical protein